MSSMATVPAAFLQAQKSPVAAGLIHRKNAMLSLFEKQKPVNMGDATTATMLQRRVENAGGEPITFIARDAKRLLSDLNFPHQRQISESRVYGHLNAIISGDWIDSFPITFVRLPDGRIWLVDGQHRLTAISRYTQGTVCVVVRIVDVDDETEARRMYAGFDLQSSVRTRVQILSAIGIAEQVGITQRVSRAVYDAAPILLNDLEPISGSPAVAARPDLFLQANRVQAINDWAAEVRVFVQAIGDARANLRRKLLSSGVLAVGLYTIRHQPEKAVQFWMGLARNDGLRRNDPRATLINDLLSRPMNSGSIRQRVQQPALAWNAWFQGRDLKIIKCIDGAAITLAGTPIERRS